jgi:quinol monooxygenase YgiN
MILITGSGRALPGSRDQLVAAARAISSSTQADEGCISYTFAASLEDDSLVNVEIWADRDALAAHMNHPHTRQFLASLDGVLEGPPQMRETEF